MSFLNKNEFIKYKDEQIYQLDLFVEQRIFENRHKLNLYKDNNNDDEEFYEQKIKRYDEEIDLLNYGRDQIIKAILKLEEEYFDYINSNVPFKKVFEIKYTENFLKPQRLIKHVFTLNAGSFFEVDKELLPFALFVFTNSKFHEDFEFLSKDSSFNSIRLSETQWVYYDCLLETTFKSYPNFNLYIVREPPNPKWNNIELSFIIKWDFIFIEKWQEIQFLNNLILNNNITVKINCLCALCDKIFEMCSLKLLDCFETVTICYLESKIGKYECNTEYVDSLRKFKNLKVLNFNLLSVTLSGTKSHTNNTKQT